MKTIKTKNAQNVKKEKSEEEREAFEFKNATTHDCESIFNINIGIFTLIFIPCFVKFNKAENLCCPSTIKYLLFNLHNIILFRQ